MAALLVGSLACAFAACSTTAKEETQVTPLQHASARQFAIEGMTCQGCADTIRAAVAKIPGVQSVDVSLEARKTTVVADPA
jgi:hypothetical protein